MDYKFFNVRVVDKVAQVEMNRPAKLNAMNAEFWQELPHILALRR